MRKNVLCAMLVCMVMVLSLGACGGRETASTPNVVSESGQSEEAKESDEEVSGSVKGDKGTQAITIKESPDKYTWYIKNYIGKNCASLGDDTRSGERYDEYGESEIELVIITEDGSFVELSDENKLKSYVVTGQSVAPNTELKLVFEKDSKGIEYGSLIEFQNIEEMELYVRRLEDIPQVNVESEEAAMPEKQLEDAVNTANAEEGDTKKEPVDEGGNGYHTLTPSMCINRAVSYRYVDSGLSSAS